MLKMRKIYLIVLVGLLAFFVSCSRKTAHSGTKSSEASDHFELVDLKEGEGLKIRTEGQSGAGICVFRTKEQLVIFQNSSEKSPIFGSPFVVKIRNESEMELLLTKMGKLEDGDGIGSIRYYDLDGDGLPDYKQDISGVYRLDRVVWKRSENQNVPTQSERHMQTNSEVRTNPSKTKSEKLLNERNPSGLR
jgi:hypothetical protein